MKADFNEGLGEEGLPVHIRTAYLLCDCHYCKFGFLLFGIFSELVNYTIFA